MPESRDNYFYKYVKAAEEGSATLYCTKSTGREQWKDFAPVLRCCPRRIPSLTKAVLHNSEGAVSFHRTMVRLQYSLFPCHGIRYWYWYR
jgi:hypothetical protein